jgi:hypothetical protein
VVARLKYNITIATIRYKSLHSYLPLGGIGGFPVILDRVKPGMSKIVPGYGSDIPVTTLFVTNSI